MDTQIQDGYYVWHPPDTQVVVHLHLEVIDRMLAEVMRGFGAVRKRGVEVGGLLIGTIAERTADHEASVVRVDDFELVPCEYRRGPSYLFSTEDGAAFESAYSRWKPSVSSEQYAVGYFRSHTREGLALAGEDIDLMEDYFPEPAHVALLIHPSGTRPSSAGFFFREGRSFPEVTPLEFPFRRRELTGEEAPPHRSLSDRRRSSFENLAAAAGGTTSTEMAIEKPVGSDITYTVTTNVPAPERPQMKAGWVWMPLSFVFLLLGLMLGFQVALSVGGRSAPADVIQDYSLGLKVSKAGENLLLRWNPDAPLVRASDRGELEIEDRGLTKPVPLDRANLQNGTITVQRASSQVKFKLTVYPRGRVSAVEAVEWKQ